MNSRKRSTALLLSIIGGGLGLDRFYLGYTWTGLLKLATVGGLGLWWLMDIFMILAGDLKPCMGTYAGVPQPRTAAESSKPYEPETPAKRAAPATHAHTLTTRRVVRRLRALPAARTVPILAKGEEPTIQSVQRRGRCKVRVKRATKTFIAPRKALPVKKRSPKQRTPAKKRAAKRR